MLELVYLFLISMSGLLFVLAFIANVVYMVSFISYRRRSGKDIVSLLVPGSSKRALEELQASGSEDRHSNFVVKMYKVGYWSMAFLFVNLGLALVFQEIILKIFVN